MAAPELSRFVEMQVSLSASCGPEEREQQVSAHKVYLTRNSFLLPLSPLAFTGQLLGLLCMSNRLRGRKTLLFCFLALQFLSLKVQRSCLELEIASGNWITNLPPQPSLRNSNSSYVLALVTMVSELLKTWTVFMPHKGCWTWVSQF